MEEILEDEALGRLLEVESLHGRIIENRMLQ